MRIGRRPGVRVDGWITRTLGELLIPNRKVIDIDPLRRYQQIKIRLWGRGVVPRGEIVGAEIGGTARTEVRAGQFIVSKIDARNGAFGIVPNELDGAVASNDFPSFDVDQERLRPRFLGWLSKTPQFVALCKLASEGTTNRKRLSSQRMLAIEVAMPYPEEQDRIVAHLDNIASRTSETQRLCNEIDEEHSAMLASAFHRIADSAPHRPMSEIAPLERRPVDVQVDAEYPQLSVRSFGRGIFHRPAVSGADITWEKPHWISAGDIVISNIKAWEGAVAVAAVEDDGRVGSHRYLTCVAKPDLAIARYVCFYLLTSQGLDYLGKASPGSADRNRTLGQDRLMQIPVPVAPLQAQQWFDDLYEKARHATIYANAVRSDVESVIPAALSQAFKGEL